MSRLLLLLLLSATPSLASIASSSVEFTIQEEQPPSILVGNIKLDGKLPTHQRYLFRLREENEYFKLNENNGELRTKTRIDLESICRRRRAGCDVLSLIANAYDRSRKLQLRAYVEVSVKISDKNDHAPIFRFPQNLHRPHQPNYYRHELTERISSPMTTKVPVPAAVDADYSAKYNRLTYSLVGYSETFRLVSSNGPRLQLLKELDREKKQNYTLTIQAQDSEGKRGELKVFIIVKDIDDNPATFSSSMYTVMVSESQPSDTIIYNVSAKDPDEHPLVYTMDPMNYDLEEGKVLKSLFSVQQDGQIRLIGSLDYEMRREYTVVVRADTPNHNAETRVRVIVQDTNDNMPKFKLNPINLQVVENRPADQSIGDVTVTDADSNRNGEVTCFDQDPNPKIKFIQKRVYNGNSYKERKVLKYDIKPQMSFDRETTPRIHARLTCTDNGLPKMSATLEAIVNVVDVNDNQPRFRQSRYLKQIPENSPKSILILQVNATDEDKGDNAKITYSLSQDGDAAAFRIGRDDGRIYAKVRLDREKKDRYTFRVTARDHGRGALSSEAVVEVRVTDTNDHSPELVGPNHFNLTENAEPNTLIGRLKARDPDLGHNGMVNFRKGAEMGHQFFILKRNGTFYNRRRIDREKDPKTICFAVIMSDQAQKVLSGKATVCVSILDVNDNPPKINYPAANSTIFVSVNEPPGKLIATVRAVDPDEGRNAEIRYVLANNMNDVFTIGQRNGDLRLSRSRRLQPEDIRIHLVTVTAYDRGTTPLHDTQMIRIVVTESTGTDFGSFMSGRRNVIIVIILSSVSGVLALVLITAIICMVRPCRLRGSRRRDFASAADSYAAAKPGWCSPLDEMRLHGQNEYSGTTSPAMSDQPLSLCVDSARPDATLFKHSLTCPRNNSMDAAQKVCLKHMDTMRSPRPYETLDRTKPLPAMGRPVDGDGQQSDSGRGASDEDLSATLHHHHAAPNLQTFHPGCPNAGGGTLRTRHLGATLTPRQMALRGQAGPGADYTLPRPASACAHGPPISEGYEVLRRQAPATPPVGVTSMAAGGGAKPVGGSTSGSRVDAEKLVEEIDQLFFKDMML